jgi:hypothetical protein
MQLNVPPTVAAYFGVDRWGYPTRQPGAAPGLPERRRITIAQVYRPTGDAQGRNRGWKRWPGGKRISISYARRHLLTDGVTHVQLTDGARFADFTLREVLRRAR